MPEEQIETGKEAAGGAGQQQTGNSATADGQQNATQDAAGNQNDEVAGLKAAAQAERTKRQEAETKLAQTQQQMQILSANTPQGQQQVTQQPASMFMQAAKQLGYNPDYLTPEETGHIMDTLLQYVVQHQQDAAFTTSHADFDEIVGKVVNGIFQESPHLQKVFDTNPGLRQAFLNTGLTPSIKLIAYQMVKNSPDYQATLKEAGMTEEQKKALEAETAIKAANAVASISSVQGGGNLDRAAQLAGMNDAEFKAEKDKVIDQAT